MLFLFESYERSFMAAKTLNYSVPKGVQENAKRGLELRKKHKRGGTSIGVARARDLINNSKLSLDTFKRMKAFFDRHSAFKEYHNDKTSAAWISWLLWGGDEGYTWANKMVRLLENT